VDIINNIKTITKGSMSDAREIVEWVMNKVLEEMENIVDMVLQDDAKQEDAINILEFPRFDRMEFNWTEMDPIYKGQLIKINSKFCVENDKFDRLLMT